MPLYEYKCTVCGFITEIFRQMSESDRVAACGYCDCAAERIPSRFTAVTDTNFGYTGKYDSRLGGPKIEGRKDFWNRVKKQNLKEVDLKEMADNPSTLKKRMEKFKVMDE